VILEVKLRGTVRRVEVEPELEGEALRISFEGHVATVRLHPLVGSEWWRLEVDDVTTPVRLHLEGQAVLATVESVRVPLEVRRWLPVRSRRSQTGPGEDRVEVRAPMPGLVTAVPLARGDEVAAGSAVAVVEAMKMQMEVPAPAAGRIDDVRVRPGEEVGAGQVLVVLRTSSPDDQETAGSAGS
jgi:biotin carboxyl carrier protein